MGKTHWKSHFNPDYLGSWSWDEQEKDKIVTIDRVVKETITGAEGKKQECIVAHLRGGLKPLIVNRTNAKTLTKLLGTPFVEDWGGKTISLYVARVSAYGETVDGIRIRSKLPDIRKPMLDETHKQWDAAVQSLRRGTTTLEKIRERFDVSDEVAARMNELTRVEVTQDAP